MASTTPLAGKTAIITGGSKGIGAATSKLFVSLGANVVIIYSSDDASANSLIESMATSTSGSQKKPIAIKGDAGSVKDIEKLVDSVVASHSKIDILVLNAGIMPMADLEHLEEETFDRVMNVNVKGPLFLTKKALPHMSSGGSVIFLSTTLNAASQIVPAHLAYCASKGAIEQSVRILSKDLFQKGITVNAVAPGPTATALFLKGKSEQMLKALGSASPAGRLGEVEDIASTIAFLANTGSNGSGWVTGQILRVNGGMI